jgi:hypothetical protein
MKHNRCTDSTKQKPTAKDYCRSIVALMAPTESGRGRAAIGVFITADLWKRIYHNARKGAK